MTNQDIIDSLNDLIETSKDGEYGFEQCAKFAQSAELKALFLQRANDCRHAVQELHSLVAQYGGTPQDTGSISGALHRGWVSVRESVSGNEDLAMLEECERGEDVAKTRYRKALEQDLPEPVRTVVGRQFEGVLSNHDQIRALRDQSRNLSGG